MRWIAPLLGAALVAAACAHPGPPASTRPVRPRVEFTPVPDGVAVQVMNPHDHEGRPLCQRCHVQGEATPSIEAVSLCSGCHDATLMRHPWHVEQKGDAGPLPLVDGKVVCHTCHDPHDVKKFPHGLRAEYSALCLNCHKRH